MTKRSLFYMACVFLLGICFANSGQWIPLAGAMLLLGYRIGHQMWLHRYRRILLWIVLTVVGFGTGYWHMADALASREQVLGQLTDGEEITVQGDILKKQTKGTQCIYELTDAYVLLSGEAVSCNHVLIPLFSDEYSIQQTLIVTGKLNTFYEAVNDGNFDQRSYYQSRMIDFEVDDGTVSAVYGKGGYAERLYRIRVKLQDVLTSITEEETAGVLSGMLLGDKSLLDSEIKTLYQKAGISHVLAISGLHISVFAAGVYQLLRKRRGGFALSALWAGVFVASYATLTGASVSTLRAAIMYVVLMLAPVFRRTYDLLNGLGLTVLLLLWANPFLVDYSGFQFSLAAMLGIGCAVRVLSQKTDEEEDTRRHRLWGKLHDALVGGLGIQAATLPLVANAYYEVPVYAILINLLVVPLLTPVLISGAAGMLAGCVWLPLGRVLVFPAYLILKLYRVICTVTLGWPFAQKITGQPQIWELIAYYAVFETVLLLRQRHMRKGRERTFMDAEGRVSMGEKESLYMGEKGRVSMEKETSAYVLGETVSGQTVPKGEEGKQKGRSQADAETYGSGHMAGWKKLPWAYLAVIMLAVCFCHCRVPDSEVDILDVGQGDGIFISAGSGYNCFIDGGSSNVSSLGTYRILPFLKAKGADHIDYWFVSHADSDHTSGIAEVLESGYRVDHLVVSYAAPQDDALAELTDAAAAAGVEVISMNEGDTLSLGEATLTCVFPFAGLSEDEINAADVDRNTRSLVLRMQLEEASFLFVGDISSEEEAELLAAGVDLNVEVYKVAHHGSRYSSSEEFLAAMTPSVSVISCSSTNNYGHPGAETVARLEALEGNDIYYTMYGGRIRILPTLEVSEYLTEKKK